GQAAPLGQDAFLRVGGQIAEIRQQAAMGHDVREEYQQHQQRNEEQRSQDGGQVGRPLGRRLVVEISTGTGKRGAIVVTAQGPPHRGEVRRQRSEDRRACLFPASPTL